MTEISLVVTLNNQFTLPFTLLLSLLQLPRSPYFICYIFITATKKSILHLLYLYYSYQEVHTSFVIPLLQPPTCASVRRRFTHRRKSIFHLLYLYYYSHQPVLQWEEDLHTGGSQYFICYTFIITATNLCFSEKKIYTQEEVNISFVIPLLLQPPTCASVRRRFIHRRKSIFHLLYLYYYSHQPVLQWEEDLHTGGSQYFICYTFIITATNLCFSEKKIYTQEEVNISFVIPLLLQPPTCASVRRRSTHRKC